jgi:GTP-binding protein LepA
MKAQVLDTLDLERERGITIKLNAVRMNYTSRDGGLYELNLIDTPGHVDFTYEVSRSLAACEGAILVVDASQGIQAQTLSNLFLALDAGLEIIPVLNKIDLPGAEPERRKQEVHDLIGTDPDRILLVSAKEGLGVPELLEEIIARVPPPTGDPDAPLRALIFDSYYDRYRGAIPSVRVVDGFIRKGMEITFGANEAKYEVSDLGYMQLRPVQTESLGPGEVGYVVANVRSVEETRAGDTIFDASNRAAVALPGYQDVHSMVFSGLYPTDTTQYEALRDALAKLKLNDASLHYDPETSTALGFGFRCGFLGLLHMEIVRERLEREFDLDLLVTAPNVAYQVKEKNGDWVEVHNPADMPRDPEEVQEPYVRAQVIVPKDYVGAVMELCTERRGRFDHMEYLSETRVLLTYELPLGEIVYDFYDQLKSRTRGYASFDYDVAGFRDGELARVDVLVGGEQVDALSLIAHRDAAYERGKLLVERLREEIPRQMFDVPIQAAIGSRVIARETVKAKRKDVLAKCYGGDITRKRKLLEKQKKGKKRMKQVGGVEVPQEAFLAVLNLDGEKKR